MGDDYGYHQDRQGYIKKTWGFDCRCPRCKSDLEQSAYHKYRNKALQALHEVAGGNISQDIPTQLLGIRICIKGMKREFRDTVYDIPRFEFAYAFMAEECVRRRADEDLNKSKLEKSFADTRYALRMIQALGAEYEFKDDDIAILRHGFVCKWLVEAYLLATVATASFYGSAHWSLRKAAFFVYGIFCGEHETFEKVLDERLEETLRGLTLADMQSVRVMYSMLEKEGLDRTELA
ncbi:hypothetical protein ABW19_dt0203761 [Dactylella cylindrospora]|nr:hypothetical protein ABW19_dt0203761 [Dactylella cylindrospora]